MFRYEIDKLSMCSFVIVQIYKSRAVWCNYLNDVQLVNWNYNVWLLFVVQKCSWQQTWCCFCAAGLVQSSVQVLTMIITKFLASSVLPLNATLRRHFADLPWSIIQTRTKMILRQRRSSWKFLKVFLHCTVFMLELKWSKSISYRCVDIVGGHWKCGSGKCRSGKSRSDNVWKAVRTENF